MTPQTCDPTNLAERATTEGAYGRRLVARLLERRLRQHIGLDLLVSTPGLDFMLVLLVADCGTCQTAVTFLLVVDLEALVALPRLASAVHLL